MRCRVYVLAVFLFSGCNQSIKLDVSLHSSIADRCAMIDAVLHHKSRSPGEPNVYRVPLVADECVYMAASWRRKLLIKVEIEPAARNLFSANETCPTFSVYTTALKADDLPTAVVSMDLTADQPDIYLWEWYVHGIAKESLGTCGPNNGRLQRVGKIWQTSDVHPD
jgi:hypothetical protein